MSEQDNTERYRIIVIVLNVIISGFLGILLMSFTELKEDVKKAEEQIQELQLNQRVIQTQYNTIIEQLREIKDKIK